MEYFIYALPLIPIVILSWLVQHANNRCILKLGEVETETPASLVAERIVQTSDLSKIAVEKGEDFTQNNFDLETNKILLSPDVYDQKDLAALGLASRAAGMAIFHTKTPDRARALKKIKSAVLIVFWVVFTVLSFGLMGKNLPTLLVGYGFLTLMILLYVIELKMKFGINRLVRERLDEMKIFSETELSAITKVIRAETVKL